jgi:hypothetical protein
VPPKTVIAKTAANFRTLLDMLTSIDLFAQDCASCR